jgi:Asp-tRNA(Asn)/Glu-tRNA(Gln) amidotransferase A subunit family amidase
VGGRVPRIDHHELMGRSDMHETLFQSVTDVAQTLSRKELSFRELTQMLLSRIESVNPALNAVVGLRREAALQEAVAADDATARGDDAGPLHGVPMTIKDSFNVAELHTTWGNPAFKDFVADSDATVVRRLRQAGAIIVGKTNVAFMLADFGQTASELYGVTNNPWDMARTPGGSSGGAAAALSAGMTFLEYGSDLVGSIRIPASFCGVYGLKPSAGIVPLSGFQPPGPPPPPSDMTYMSAVGPLGRSPRDLRTALSVTAGPRIRRRRLTPGHFRHSATPGWRIFMSASCSTTNTPPSPASLPHRCPTLWTHSPEPAPGLSKAGPMAWTPCSTTNRSDSTCSRSSPSRNSVRTLQSSRSSSTTRTAAWRHVPTGTATSTISMYSCAR